MLLFAHTSITAVKYGMCSVKHNQKDSKNYKIELLEFSIMNMSNDTDHSVALQALGWEPFKTEREKGKAKIMYKLLNKMGLKSLTNLFTYKSEMTNYKLRNISSSLCLPQPRTNNMKKSFI